MDSSWCKISLGGGYYTLCNQGPQTPNPGIRRFLRLHSPSLSENQSGAPALMYLLTTVLNFHGKTQNNTAPENHWFFARVLVKPSGSLKVWEVTGTGGSISADIYFLLLLSTQNQCFFLNFIFKKKSKYLEPVVF